jgi:hypothetical protein
MNIDIPTNGYECYLDNNWDKENNKYIREIE